MSAAADDLERQVLAVLGARSGLDERGRVELRDGQIYRWSADV